MTLEEKISLYHKYHEIGRKLQAIQDQERPLQRERDAIIMALAKHYKLDVECRTNTFFLDKVVWEAGQNAVKVREEL